MARNFTIAFLALYIASFATTPMAQTVLNSSTLSMDEMQSMLKNLNASSNIMVVLKQPVHISGTYNIYLADGKNPMTSVLILPRLQMQKYGFACNSRITFKPSM